MLFSGRKEWKTQQQTQPYMLWKKPTPPKKKKLNKYLQYISDQIKKISSLKGGLLARLGMPKVETKSCQRLESRYQSTKPRKTKYKNHLKTTVEGKKHPKKHQKKSQKTSKNANAWRRLLWFLLLRTFLALWLTLSIPWSPLWRFGARFWRHFLSYFGAQGGGVLVFPLVLLCVF